MLSQGRSNSLTRSSETACICSGDVDPAAAVASKLGCVLLGHDCVCYRKILFKRSAGGASFVPCKKGTPLRTMDRRSPIASFAMHAAQYLSSSLARSFFRHGINCCNLPIRRTRKYILGLELRKSFFPSGAFGFCGAASAPWPAQDMKTVQGGNAAGAWASHPMGCGASIFASWVAAGLNSNFLTSQNSTTKAPQVLVHVSICKGPFWVPIFDPQPKIIA